LKLRIGKDFTLPAEAVTETFAILAKRGVGKTYTAKKMAEQMLKAAAAPIAVVDPIGVWWGLRSSADGRGPGLPILVLGGEYADAPLDVGAGEIVARMLVEERLSAVLDLSQFRKNEQTRFMTDFAERLYHSNREALHLFLDEADAFAPQKPFKGQERLLGAIEDIVRRGRARGIGVTLITQRAAVINKDVLTQAEVLVALRTIAPQDRAAIEAWIRVHGSEEQGDELMVSLPSLPVGTAWFWSPGWLDVFQRVEVEPIETFDSSATPKAGKAAKKPKQLAEVDIAAVRERLAAQFEKAKAEDPRELRAEIARLRAELGRKPPADPTIALARESEIRKEAARSVHQEYGEIILDIAGAADRLNEALVQARHLAQFVDTITLPRRLQAAAGAPSVQSPARPKPATTAPSPGAGKLSKGGRRILTALAQFGESADTKLGALTGLVASAGHFGNLLSELRTAAYVEGERSALRITSAGLAALGSYEPLPTGRDLHAWWLSRLPKGAAEILRVLISVHPRALSDQEIGERIGKVATAGHFGNMLSELRTRELIMGPRSALRASEDLFA
jgi:hypothetical protein